MSSTSSSVAGQIPPELARLIDNCVILVEEFPPPDEPDLLGLYDGIPLTERGETYAGALPDRILIFRPRSWPSATPEEDVVEEVHITVVHEVAHHFGIDDDRCTSWATAERRQPSAT